MNRWTLARICAAGAIAFCLVFQLAGQLHDSRARFWPFIPYGMYSLAHRPGSTFDLRELRVAQGESGTPVSAVELRVSHFVFASLLTLAARGESYTTAPESDGAAHLLGRLIAERYAPDGSASAEIWTRTFEIGPEGLRTRDVPWVLTRRWDARP